MCQRLYPKIWKISKNLKKNPKIWIFLKICLIKCLKGHKSLGSLCSVVKTLIVSGAGPRDGQGHLLSCCGQLKRNTKGNISCILYALWETYVYILLMMYDYDDQIYFVKWITGQWTLQKVKPFAKLFFRPLLLKGFPTEMQNQTFEPTSKLWGVLVQGRGVII